MVKPDEELDRYEKRSTEITDIADKVCSWLWEKHESHAESLDKDSIFYLMGATMYIKSESTYLLEQFARRYSAQVANDIAAEIIQQINHAAENVTNECIEYESNLKYTFGEFYRFCSAVERFDIFIDVAVADIHKKIKEEQKER